MTKTCPKCQTEKEFSCFSKDRSTLTGLATWCKDCCRAKNKRLYTENHEERKAKQRAWSAANPEKVANNNRRQYERHRLTRIKKAIAWNKAHPDKVRAKGRRYYQLRKGYYLDKSIWRHHAIKQATPSWADQRAIRHVYREARRMTRETGIPHEVDHIIPLTSIKVCGLHVAENLRVVPRTVNRLKHNHFTDDKSVLTEEMV
jgi:hypothetical protein